MVTNNLLIAPVDNDLGSDERGLLGSMVNVAEYDYKSMDELCDIFQSDSRETLIAAAEVLCDKGYLIKLGDVFAVNKLLIPSMKVIRRQISCLYSKRKLHLILR